MCSRAAVKKTSPVTFKFLLGATNTHVLNNGGGTCPPYHHVIYNYDSLALVAWFVFDMGVTLSVRLLEKLSPELFTATTIP